MAPAWPGRDDSATPVTVSDRVLHVPVTIMLGLPTRTELPADGRLSDRATVTRAQAAAAARAGHGVPVAGRRAVPAPCPGRAAFLSGARRGHWHAGPGSESESQ
jgi:hypothetical protein